MTTESQRETATIYTFPARGRFAVESDGKAARQSEQRAAPTVTGSGWYHDEAIREEHERKDHERKDH
jgi:hypothetical protein